MYTLPNPYAEETGDDEVTLVVDIKLKPGTEASIEKLMASTIETNRAEAGCTEFTFLKVRGKTSDYILIERWRTQKDLDWHMSQPYTQKLFGQLEESLAFPLSEVYDHISFTRELLPRAS